MATFLFARWNDYTPSDDTEEPLRNAAQHHMKQLLTYITRLENKELLKPIQLSKEGVFGNKILQEISKLVVKN
jgi:hypothetical protein